MIAEGIVSRAAATTKHGVGTAEFDRSEVYRYSLTRLWNGTNFDKAKTVLWIMMNPSTADESKLDPTITRCFRFSNGWGYDGLEVVNIMAFRSTDPKRLPANPEERDGPGNLAAINRGFRRNQKIIAAWGAPWASGPREKQIFDMSDKHRKSLWCLAKNNGGSPRHPLYVSSSNLPRIFRAHAGDR